jgi:3-phosphoshikimate 1-carboxyvinyltransferase
MSDITLTPFAKPFSATISPPGSKSLTNRALVLAALAEGESHLSNILIADDTQVMLESLEKLGFQLTRGQAGQDVRIVGTGGKVPAAGAELFCGNSGTTIRFLAALCSLGKGQFTLDGIARMRQRPIAELGTMLRNLGVRVSYPLNEGFPPITLNADSLPGGRLHFGAAQSSQYLSAVLQVAPYARNEVIVDLAWPQTSWPYVAMTMRLMDEFHHTPELIRNEETGDPEQIIVPQGTYTGRAYHVEPDASNASYFLAAAAIREGSKVTIEGLGKQSLQGDVRFADVLHEMGADLIFGRDFVTIMGTGRLSGIDVSMADMPDMAQTLAVAALFAEGPTTMRGLHTLRVKETDRIAALATELQKLGAQIEVEGDTMTIEPPDHLRPAAIDTYDDHRMAMSFAVAATRSAGITIRNKECTNKTYPNFFDDLQKLSSP